MTPKKSIEERVRETAQEFRGSEIEYQLMAYLLRANPSSCGMVKRDWWSDIILQDIFIVVDDLRITMTKAMTIHELNERKIIGTDEDLLYEEVVDQLFAQDITGFNVKNTKHMMVEILTLSESRKVLTGCGEVIGQMRNFNLADAQKKLAVLSRPSGLVDKGNAGFYLDDFEERKAFMVEKKELMLDSEDGIAGVATGIRAFDSKVGGIMPGEFGIIAGITGVGKTAALVSFAIHAWLKGENVMLVSGEMNKFELSFRVDSFLTRISGMKFRTAELTDADHEQWSSTMKLYKAKQDNYLYIATYPRKFTVDNIERDMTRLYEETGKKTKVLCMDYINIMLPLGKGEGGWKDQSDAVWDFKGLVSEYNLVGWTAGQVKDEAYEKELYDASDLKYARAISECAPVIAALIRTPKDILENQMKLQIIKMRNADPLKRPLALTPKLSIMRIHEELHIGNTLRGRKGATLNMQVETKKVRPKRTLKGL